MRDFSLKIGSFGIGLEAYWSLNLTPEPAINYSWFNKLMNGTKMTGEWLAWWVATASVAHFRYRESK